MSYVQINIGRNHDTGPMPQSAWDEFINEVQDSLTDLAVQYAALASDQEWEDARGTIEIHFGQGNWQGTLEESAHISIFFDHEPNEHHLNCLKTDLGAIRRKFHQDAVALIVGSVLV